MNSRELRKQAEMKREEYLNYYIGWFSSLIHNSFEITGSTVNETAKADGFEIPKIPKRYILRTLIKFGYILYDKETKLLLRGRGAGIDIYGLPTEYYLYGANGYTLVRKANEVVVLRVNDLSMPIEPYLRQQANKIVDFDLAIEQNLEACKTMTLVGFEKEAELLTFVNMAENRRVGATYCYVNKNINNIRDTLKVDQTGATYLVDKLQVARKCVIDETLQKLGIQYANTDKRERVQNAEVNASLGLAYDNIHIWDETFNYDAKFGGVDIQLKLKTSLEKLYVDGSKNEETDNKIKTDIKNNN